jgi:hypothetical protein
MYILQVISTLTIWDRINPTGLIRTYLWIILCVLGFFPRDKCIASVSSLLFALISTLLSTSISPSWVFWNRKLLNCLWNPAQVWDQILASILIGGVLYRIVGIRTYSSQPYWFDSHLSFPWIQAAVVERSYPPFSCVASFALRNNQMC